MYWVSQQVWNRLRTVCVQSEFSFTKKYVLCSIKLLFEPFFANCEIKNGFLSNFSPITNNLLNKLLHKTIGEKFLKIPFSFLQFTKNGSKAILWSTIHISSKNRNFRKRCSLRSKTYLSLFQTCWDTL